MSSTTDETTAGPASAGPPPTPELSKQSEIIKSGRNLTISKFLDWLESQDYVVASWSEQDEETGESELYEAYTTKEGLVAGFFGIDLDKIEAERGALLKYLRERQT